MEFDRRAWEEAIAVSGGGVAPDVSVIVPTHDRSELLRQTLRTVLWQERVDLEVIVVDDGSTDDTSDVVCAIDDERVRLVRHPVAEGVSVARNRGIAEARGEWIAFLDDDDLWAPDKLASQLDAIRSSGRRWAYTGAVNITIEGRIIGGAPPLPPEVVRDRLPQANLVPGGCSGVLLRRDGLEEGEVFDGSYHHFADWDLWNRLARDGMPAWVPKPHLAYRVHAGNASHDTEGMLAELDTIERRYGGPVDRVRFFRHVARVSRRGGRRRRALKYYLRAATLGDQNYLRHGFVPDVREVLDELVQEFGRHVGRPMPWIRPREREDPFRSWKEQARPWLDRLREPSGT